MAGITAVLVGISVAISTGVITYVAKGMRASVVDEFGVRSKDEGVYVRDGSTGEGMRIDVEADGNGAAQAVNRNPKNKK